MSEYQVKVKVITGNLLPPYSFNWLHISKASSAKEAIEELKADYREKVGIVESEEHPLIIEEVGKI